MPEIRPFKALRYRVSESDLPAVLAPPYDVIPPEQAQELARRDPRNVVRLILNQRGGPEGYAEAGETFRAWQSEGILTPDPAPALYLLEQTFEIEGKRHVRRGLLARFRAEEPERGTILPHEQTRKAPREDRYAMLRAARANFSPIFLMFADQGGRFAERAASTMAASPETTYTDDGGVHHRLWSITNPEGIESLVALLSETKAYIADGHHRHATALGYRDEKGPDGAWTMGYFTALDDPGLVVLPYHRIASVSVDLGVARSRLEPFFTVTDGKGVRSIASAVEASHAPWAFGLATTSGEGLVVEARPSARELMAGDAAACLRVLDSFFLHQAVLEPLLGIRNDAIEYVHSLSEAEAAVGSGQVPVTILMRSTPVRQIVDVAEARESMPAKSTFFHPKLPSGLVIHPLVV